MGFDLTAPAVGYHRFTDVAEINFQCNRWIQTIGPDGVTDLRSLGTSPRTNSQWIDAFLSLAGDVRRQGRDLDAAYYERGAEFLMPPRDPRKLPLRRGFISALREAYGVEPVLVPYQDGFLPAFDLHPGRPATSTWVIFGGFDSYIEEFLPMFAAVAAEGRRVIAFDGPGQGGALEEYGLTLTPEWSGPVGTVLDYFGLDDVTLVGMSLGGALVIQAAGDRRARRVVAWNAMDDFLEVMLAHAAPVPSIGRLIPRLPAPALDAALRARAKHNGLVAWALWQGEHTLGVDRPAGLLRAAASYRTQAASPLVHGDVLLLQGADDHYVPARQIWRQARALTGARSVTTRTFTAAEDASAHCQVGNMSLALRTILAWEAQHLSP